MSGFKRFGGVRLGAARSGIRGIGRGQYRWVAGAVAVVLVLPLTGTPRVTAAASASGLGGPKLPAPRVDKVKPFVARAGRADAALARKAEAATAAAARRALQDQSRPVVWPKAGTATVAVPVTGAATVRSGSLPVTVAGPARKPDGRPSGQSKGRKADTAGGESRARASVPGLSAVRVQVLDQAQAARAGVAGVVMTAVAAEGGGGPATLSVDYSAFAGAYGGDWAGRLELVRLPACALSAPQQLGCRTRTPLRFHNDRRARRISALVDVPAAGTAQTATGPGQSRAAAPPASSQQLVLALTAGGKSGAGDYRATPLSASSAWQAGGSSGSFTWNYPLRVPPTAAGPTPQLSISYDSGSVDGRTASANNQGILVGEGFEQPGSSYVERRYDSCDDDGHNRKYDLCWKYDNAVLVLNGKSTRLVQVGDTNVWRLKDDDASKVEKLTGAANGARNGEHWKVTTGDGTQYFFGLHRLDGAGGDDPRTNSVWTVPVFGDDADEPCHGETFDASDCVQAWRWNLDYVVDTHGNAMSYWYTAEHNNYAKNGRDTPGADYVRGGYLNRIEYGQRDGHLFDAGAHAPQKVVFATAERCLASGDGCESLTESTKGRWPDVPFDAICDDGKQCTGNDGPSFFTRKRLTGIATYVWDAAASPPGYRAVDSWSLAHSYLDPGDTGDGSDQTLWLDNITHTGMAGPDPITLPPVTFSHTWKMNRVDGATDDILPLNKPRLYTITSETGAVTVVNYSDEDCVRGGRMPPSPDSNTLRCFPVKWKPNGVEDPRLDYFHKYVVTEVRTSDPTGGAPTVEYRYSYGGGAAWHYDDDPMTPANQRTWSQWRGFSEVTAITGNPNDPVRSKTVSIYLRGMNGDRQAEGPRRSEIIRGIAAPPIADDDELPGFTRETVTYDGVTGPEVTGTVDDPWTRETASRDNPVPEAAHYVRTGASHVRTRITSGTTPTNRVRTTVISHDDYGMAAAVEDRGDDSKSGDETCTRTWYARNRAKGLTALVSRVQTLATTCDSDADPTLPPDSASPGDVVADTATAYDDNATWSPTQILDRGEPRWTGRAAGYAAGGTPAWQTVATTAYDELGRPKTVTDAQGHTTTTSYTPAGAGPLTSTEVSNPKAHKITTVIDPASGQPTRTTDANNKVTYLRYDALGRLTNVWLPNVRQSVSPGGNLVFGYQVSRTAPSWTSTASLQGNGLRTYNTSFQLYDALLRPRQSQVPSARGGRVIAETFYDSRGLAVTTYADIYDDTAGPSGALVGTVYAQAPTETRTVYDGAGRVKSGAFVSYGVQRWSTATSYTGDSVATTAVAGGSATRQVTDVFGRVVERRAYSGTDPNAAAFTAAKFTYTPAGQVATVTGPDQAKWTYGYDLFGRKVRDSDPDKGTTTTGYTVLDQVAWTEDANGAKLLYDYDELGRKTGEWSGSVSEATKQAAWTYDGVVKGQQDSAVRYLNGVGGPNSQAYTRKITEFDPLYRPKVTQVVLPPDEPLVAAGVSPTLEFRTGYNIDGTVQYTNDPAAGGLPRERIDYEYNALGIPVDVAGASGYLLGAAYSPLGDAEQLHLGRSETNPNQVWVTSDYEPGTRRLVRSYVADSTHAYLLQDLKSRYDDAGNVTSISDPTSLGGTGKADYQCFSYDGFRRLQHAWTPKTADCAASGRTVPNLGGAAPYWAEYAYTAGGMRDKETVHAAAGNAVTGYTYGGAGGLQPHVLAKTVTTPPAGPPVTRTFGYDKVGNTNSRPGVRAPQQTLGWDVEGRLAAVSEPAAGSTPATATGYLYDADGGLLIRRPAGGDGETVLYLGSTEVHLVTAGAAKTLKGVRYYTAGVGGQTIAMRAGVRGVSGTKVTWLAGDHHGTAGLAVDDETLNPVKRYTAPFGAPRGPQPAGWPDDKRFLGKPADPTTGLTHVGAREYDPTLGRFLSVDPILDPGDPQSLNGYAYAGNNPASFADPTGLFCDGCEYGGSGEHHQDTYPGRNGNDGPGSSGGGTHHASSGGGGCSLTAGSYPTCSGGGSAASGGGRRNSNGYCGYPASCKPLGSRDLKTWQVAALTATMALPVGLACIPLFLECAAAGTAGTTGAADAAAGGSLLAGGAAGMTLLSKTPRGTAESRSALSSIRLAEDLRTGQAANPLMESLRATGQLPPNYVTRAQAEAAGWRPGKALDNYVPDGQLGGDIFRDPASIGLPTIRGRIWYEADVGLSGTMSRAKQPGTRLLYSSDGLAFVTPDHYGRLYQLPGWRP